jgi:hypothetical protein
MKLHLLLFMWVSGICICTKAQQGKIVPVANSVAGNRPDGFMLQKDSSVTRIPDQQYYLRKSRIHTINGLVLFAGGSVMSALGARNESTVGFATQNLHGQPNKYERVSSANLAVTGIVMMAGSIPYFISALRNKNKAGLKITSQRNLVCAGNKGYKKVTSITYCIPLGKAH